jgi:flagellar M-ring protein FliF
VQPFAVPALKSSLEPAALETGLDELPTPDQIAAEKQKQRMQMVFDQVTDHLRREPAQSTRLLQSWIHTE